MNKLEQFKKDREIITRHASQAIDATRAQFSIDERTIKGYAIVWNSKNDYDEVVIKGAASNSINARGVGSNAGNKIVILNQHNQRQPLCLPTKLIEDYYGLYFEATIDEGISYCDDVIASIRQGTLSQLSYGFDYIWDKVEYDADNDALILKEIKLWEISLVTFSSDPNAHLRSYRENQIHTILGKFSKEDIIDLQNLLALSGRAATSTQDDKHEDNFINQLKLF